MKFHEENGITFFNKKNCYFYIKYKYKYILYFHLSLLSLPHDWSLLSWAWFTKYFYCVRFSPLMKAVFVFHKDACCIWCLTILTAICQEFSFLNITNFFKLSRFLRTVYLENSSFRKLFVLERWKTTWLELFSSTSLYLAIKYKYAKLIGISITESVENEEI